MAIRLELSQDTADKGTYMRMSEFETAYRREAFRRIRRNAQRSLRETARFNTSKWTIEERKALERDRRVYANLVEAIPTPAYLGTASLDQLIEVLAEVNRRVPRFYPTGCAP